MAMDGKSILIQTINLSDNIKRGQSTLALNLLRFRIPQNIVIAFAWLIAAQTSSACFDSLTNSNLKRPLVGEIAKLTYVCDSPKAADYLIEALRTNNQLQQIKAQLVCQKKNELGTVIENRGGYWYPNLDTGYRLYSESITVEDDLFGKQVHGIAEGCGEALTQDEKREQAFINAEREAKALEKIRNQNEAELTVLEHLAAEKAMANALDAMVSRITRSWVRPPDAIAGKEVYFRLSLSTDGGVEDVRIIRSSGDKAFDKSAVEAAKRAAPFKETLQFSPGIFEEKFRNITVKFSPGM